MSRPPVVSAARAAAPAVLLAVLLAFPVAAAVPPPPPTAVAEVRDTLHGVEIVDPYRWLEDQQSPATRAWIDAQNAHTDALLGALPGREAMKERLARLMRADAVGTPRIAGGRYFFSRRAAGQDLSVLVMRRGPDARDEVLVDPHGWTPDHSVSVMLLDVSEDGRMIAYGVRTGGADEVVVRFLDVDERRTLPDTLPLGRYLGIEIHPDRGGFHYSRFGREGARVHTHAFGAGPAGDPLVFGEGRGPAQLVYVQLSPDGRWALYSVLHGSAASRVELWAQDRAAGGPVVPVVTDLDATFAGGFAGDRLILHTNWKAPNGRVLAIDLREPSRERWTELVPEGTSALQSIALAGGRVFALYLENVVSRVRVFEADGRPAGEVALPGTGTVTGLGGRWDAPEAVFTFSSLASPAAIHRVDAASLRRSEWWRSPVPVAPGDFVVRQEWCVSKDGTRVPMFLLHRKGVKADGRRPVLMYGYGGFRQSMTSVFRPEAARWAEMGGVFAMVNLRGGAEFGEPWHEAGMLGRKQNTFDDLIAAAEWLIANRWTVPARLAISGGSNGGLLVGAAMTQRPDLFRAVLCGVPLLDMLRYHRFLVARFWVSEYGSSENAEQFRWLHAYSPYHRVAPGTAYPAVMFVTGDADTRVAPLHARKMTALLQAASTSGHPVLLHYDTQAGHAAGKSVAKAIEDETDELMFLAWQLGVDPAAGSGPRARGAALAPSR